MKKDSSNAAFAAPYFSEAETRQIGETPDKRAVWRSDSGPPFTIAHDAKGRMSLLALDGEEFQALPDPHKTFSELTKATETDPPVGTIRGPFRTGLGRNPDAGVNYMVKGSGGWVPVNLGGPFSEWKECESAAKAYALKLISNPES